MILIPLAIILVPLTQSFFQLKTEIARKQQENRIEKTAHDLWRQYFEKAQNGEVRSYLDDLSVKDNDGKLEVYLRVFDNISYTASERTEYVRLLASSLNRSPNSLTLQIVEIPTSARDAKTRPEKVTPPSVAQLQSSFLQRVQIALTDLRLPPPARQVDYQITNGPADSLHVQLSYISERDIGADAQMLLDDDVKTRLGFPTAMLGLERIPTDAGDLSFERDKAAWKTNGAHPLAEIGFRLRGHPRLKLEVGLKQLDGERDEIVEERRKVLTDYLQTNWQIAPERIVFKENPAGFDVRNGQNAIGRIFLPE
jgi:hypothetical protein